MLKIYYTIASIYKRYYSTRSKDFKAGFEECLRLVDIGMCKHPQYNAFVLVHELEKEKEEQLKIIREHQRTIRKLTNKVREKSLFAQTPAQRFTEHEVALADQTSFTIIHNLENESFKNMCVNFAFRYKWQDATEAKAMMIQFINSKSSQGFKAYKDEKTAIKEGVKIKK
jgi:hypothetical protein